MSRRRDSVWICSALLSVPGDAGPRALMRAARQAGHALPSLVLSLLERAGEQVGSRHPDPERWPRRSAVHHFPEGSILGTPVGDYDLRGRAVVERVRYEAALAHLSERGEEDA